jgi:aldehyde:ferredoxin oxidoreductase
MKAKYGYMGKMLFVDLTNNKTYEEYLTEDLARKHIGGYGIGSRIIYEKMKPGVDPLSPGNILGIGTGPFTGCGTVSTSRFITMGKSPLTGYWGDANSGGNFPKSMKSAGYDFVFFEGKAEYPVYVLVTDDKVEIKDAAHLWGRNIVETEEIIRTENNDKSLKIVCIGTAGEKLSRISAIMNDGGRAAARSGLGAVMGSKNVKALACTGSKNPEVFDKETVKRLNDTLRDEIMNNPGPGVMMLKHSGTAGATVPHLAAHAVAIKNFGGNNVDDFPEDKWENLGYEAMEKYLSRKYACTGCPIACGGILNIENGEYAVKNAHKPEYETVGSFGSNCLIDSIEAVIYANDLCNLHGLDTISAGCTLAFAIECYENGIITKNDTDGLELTWGNDKAMIGMLKKMCMREGFGDILAEGAKEAARKIGKGSEQFSMDVGGELLPMHDPREDNGWGATYVEDATPARHTRGGTQMVGNYSERFKKMMGLPESFDKLSYEGKGVAHAKIRSYQHHINNVGLCLFTGDSVSYYPMLELMQSIMGWKDMTLEEMLKAGERTTVMLHAFNLREGFKPNDFIMPSRAAGDPPFKVGPFKGMTFDFENLKRQFYEAMSFDYETGAIAKEKIEEMGLQDVLK